MVGRAGRILVVGSVNEDVVLRVPRFPHPGETLPARGLERRPGGKGANQAVAAARAGASVSLLAKVGADEAGARMVRDLRQSGVDTSMVDTVPGVATGAAYIMVAPDGENTIVVDPGANCQLSAEDVLGCSDALPAVAVIVTQLEVPLAAVIGAIEMARRHGARAVLTLSPARDVPGRLLAAVDPLLVNESEAALVLGDATERPPEETARRLLRRGAQSVVVTLGAGGAVCAERDGVVRLPAQPVREVVDTTGAGDSFAGALAAALSFGASLREAVGAGLVAGAVTVGRTGAR